MKKRLMSLILSAMIISVCGCDTAENPALSEETTAESAVSETAVLTDTDKPVQTGTVNRNDMKKMQKYSIDIDNSKKPEVIKAELIAVCKGDIKNHVTFRDIYDINVLHSGVVGLVGVPFEIYLDSSIENAVISFYYNTDELRGIPEDNLIMLHYNEESCSYDTVQQFKVNKNLKSVSAAIHEEGVYLLADAYTWYSCWGIDASDYEYEIDKSAYISDWERECDTGDIMKIADTEWAAENAPEFHVTSPQQLAGVVYYVNALNAGAADVYIYLENDIDLSGYEWKPMGWDKSCLSGTVDGQGHTISNMKIADEYRTAFIGYGLGTEVYDISFENADISGCSYTGIVGGEIYSSRNWHDIHVSGNVTASGSDDYGTIIGREANISFKNCTYDDVLVNGEKFDYPSYRYKRIDETEIIEAFTLSFDNDGNIVRTDSESGEYRNLGWYILRDGELMLHRNAENELVLDKSYFWGDEIYLVAYINGAYVRVSNIITF